MRIIVSKDPDSVVQEAAGIVERFVSASESPALGLATGKTMEGLFAELVSRYRRQGLSFRTVDAYLLDEYVGLDRCDPNTYRSFVHRLFARHVDMESGSLHGPDPQAPNLGAECVRYEQEVQAASIGLQILGIGSNGHIAFNEPGTPFDSVTRVVELSGQTRNDNARFFPAGHSVPAQAMTQGIATILAASELLLVACGVDKASAVARAIEGPITDAVPASAIQLHSKVAVVLDPLAAQGLLYMQDYAGYDTPFGG